MRVFGRERYLNRHLLSTSYCVNFSHTPERVRSCCKNGTDWWGQWRTDIAAVREGRAIFLALPQTSNGMRGSGPRMMTVVEAVLQPPSPSHRDLIPVSIPPASRQVAGPAEWMPASSAGMTTVEILRVPFQPVTPGLAPGVHSASLTASRHACGMDAGIKCRHDGGKAVKETTAPNQRNVLTSG